MQVPGLCLDAEPAGVLRTKLADGSKWQRQSDGRWAIGSLPVHSGTESHPRKWWQPQPQRPELVPTREVEKRQSPLKIWGLLKNSKQETRSPLKQLILGFLPFFFFLLLLFIMKTKKKQKDDSVYILSDVVRQLIAIAYVR